MGELEGRVAIVTGSSSGIGDVAPSLVWAKLRSLRAGADLASERLL